MSSHITSLCRSINFSLWNISRIRRFINRDTTSHAMRALVLSRLDYANSLLIGCNSSNITRLQRLQNRAARIIFQVARRHSTTPLLASLHWLPVKDRIAFKTLLYIFKSLNDQAPSYLTDCITIYESGRPGLRSAADTTRLAIPRNHRVVGGGAFSIAGPKLWNNLPSSIRSCPTVSSFKSHLKTHLFTS
ncbi:uncharacterized protein [Amphiura filiformis]|uniref:uncharacterized protein n=1 Tax=Amphiura filiformis TaxID=82378 RepID=UPI003B217D97